MKQDLLIQSELLRKVFGIDMYEFFFGLQIQGLEYQLLYGEAVKDTVGDRKCLFVETYIHDFVSSVYSDYVA